MNQEEKEIKEFLSNQGFSQKEVHAYLKSYKLFEKLSSKDRQSAEKEALKFLENH